MNGLVHLMNRSCALSTERLNHFRQLSRFISTTNARNCVKSFELDIPQRPKKPLNGYLRFCKELQPAFRDSGKRQSEIIAIASERWKAFTDSEKAKYKEQYKQEKILYDQKMTAYNKLVTKDQKLALKEVKIKKQYERIVQKDQTKKRALDLQHKRRLNELGKPKRSFNSYMMFVDEQRRQNPGTAPKDLKNKYDALTESQKDVYKQKAVAAFAQYKKATEEWEEEMISKGLDELIRNEPILAKS